MPIVYVDRADLRTRDFKIGPTYQSEDIRIRTWNWYNVPSPFTTFTAQDRLGVVLLSTSPVLVTLPPGETDARVLVAWRNNTTLNQVQGQPGELIETLPIVTLDTCPFGNVEFWWDEANSVWRIIK